MIIDTSAIITILRNEPEAKSFIHLIAMSSARRMSAATLLEAAIVVDNRIRERVGARLDDFIRRAGITIEPVTEAQVAIARQAYLAYGRGNHPAGLNFGDCFAYALAKDMGEPLLFKGADFAQTDVEPALT